MRLRPATRRGARAALLAGTAAALLIALAGCGSVGFDDGTGDRSTGKELFVERCGSCHVLADAGTTGAIGPNLDDAFRQSRADGLGESTFVQVVKGQIFYPVVNPPTGEPGMPGIDTTLPACVEDEGTEEPQPAGCVLDQEQAASDIAAYVAAVAGTQPSEAP